jgi:hypothetical protein
MEAAQARAQNRVEKGKKNRRTDPKKGVPFKMMFRHHMDPDYYDPKANDKIFVPDLQDPNVLSEKQKAIVESFPERDRGLYSKESKIPVEEDPLEAAVKKMRIRKDHKLKEKAEKKKKVHFGIEGEEGDESSEKDSAEYFQEGDESGGDHSDYEDINSEDDEEGEESKGAVPKEDPTEILKKAKLLRPTEGVKFVQYDEYGIPLAPDQETGFDY